jgi:pilus assembly protein TadC
VSGQLAAAAVLLAAAVLVLPRRVDLPRRRLRTRQPSDGGSAVRTQLLLPWLCGLAVGALAAVLVGGAGGVAVGGGLALATTAAARRWLRAPTATAATEPARLAGAWDLLAACLRAGLPVAAAIRAVADQLPGPEGRALCRVAELLALGADPAGAWAPALATPGTLALARAARRTARSGSAMAGAVAELADQLRATAADRTEERAQRTGVLITGPLGLCFLPAFVCLGIVPVVIGLAAQLTVHQ